MPLSQLAYNLDLPAELGIGAESVGAAGHVEKEHSAEDDERHAAVDDCPDVGFGGGEVVFLFTPADVTKTCRRCW